MTKRFIPESDGRGFRCACCKVWGFDNTGSAERQALLMREHWPLDASKCTFLQQHADLLPAAAFEGTRFVEDELRTAFVAFQGLQRVYASLLNRENRADADRLAFAILKLRRIFDDTTPREVADDDARLQAAAAVRDLAQGVADLAKEVGALVVEMKRFI